MKAILLLLCVTTACNTVACARRMADDLEATSATLLYLEDSYGLVHHAEIDALLVRVSRRLLRAERGLTHFAAYKDIDAVRISDLPWQVYVVGDSAPNAFAIGSGVVVLTKGMLRSLETEAELAAVLAHEMAHEMLDHTIHTLALQAEESGLRQHYDTRQEIAADRLSALLLHAAGYEPEASLEALARVQQVLAEPRSMRFAERAAALRSVIDGIPRNRPYIRNTREYNRARRALF